jgi:hypothetical protein
MAGGYAGPFVVCLGPSWAAGNTGSVSYWIVLLLTLPVVVLLPAQRHMHMQQVCARFSCTTCGVACSDCDAAVLQHYMSWQPEWFDRCLPVCRKHGCKAASLQHASMTGLLFLLARGAVLNIVSLVCSTKPGRPGCVTVLLDVNHIPQRICNRSVDLDSCAMQQPSTNHTCMANCIPFR